LPEKIPTLIEHDVTALNLGDHVKTSDLTLPEGVEVRLPESQTVAGIVAPEKEKAEDVQAAVPGAVAAGAAPAAGAPAAGAAPAAAGKDDKKAAAAPAKKK
jgi:large subunit ribosomal protein L25